MSIKAGNDYGFAKDVNSVPLLASEFDLSSTEYAIVFSGEGKDVMPAALLGIRDQENLYVDESGAWNAKYIPAFVRRYPFVFSTQDKNTFNLCLDEDFPGVNRKGVGERLFDAEGERTQYLRKRARLPAGLSGAIRGDARFLSAAGRPQFAGSDAGAVPAAVRTADHAGRLHGGESRSAAGTCPATRWRGWPQPAISI